MAAAPAKHHNALPVAAGPVGTVAAGGPTAEMQRLIESRLSTPVHAAAVGVERDLAHGVSRLAGPALLMGAYLALAAWWF